MNEYKVYDKKELAQRLINGEVFVTKDGIKVYFDEKQRYSPFMYGYEVLDGAWEWDMKPYDPKDDWADKSLVWAWDDDDWAFRLLAVWDAKHKFCFDCGGYRGNQKYHK